MDHVSLSKLSTEDTPIGLSQSAVRRVVEEEWRMQEPVPILLHLTVEKTAVN